jgi:hypothetical protein
VFFFVDQGSLNECELEMRQNGEPGRCCVGDYLDEEHGLLTLC